MQRTGSQGRLDTARAHHRRALASYVEIGLPEAHDVHRRLDLAEPAGRTVLEGQR